MIPSPFSYVRVSVLQPGGSDDTSVDMVEIQSHLEALAQDVAGRLAVSGVSAAVEVKMLIDSGLGITAISEELVEALQGQLGMTQTALTQTFVGHARVVTSFGQECDNEAQLIPLHVTIKTPWGPARFAIAFIVLSWGGDVVFIGQKTLREKLGIDVMAQLKAYVLKAKGRRDGAGTELTARSVGEPNDGVRVAMAVTAFVPGGDAPGDVDDEVTLTLPSQLAMIFHDSEVVMRDRAGVLETAVDNAVDHGPRRNVPRCCAMSFFARTLTCYVGRCRVTHLHARSLGRSHFIQGQGWRGRSPRMNLIACGGGRQSRAPTAAR